MPDRYKVWPQKGVTLQLDDLGEPSVEIQNALHEARFALPLAMYDSSNSKEVTFYVKKVIQVYVETMAERKAATQQQEATTAQAP